MLKFKIDWRILSHFDLTLVFLFLPLVIMSGFLINENNSFLGQKFLVYALCGIILFVIIFFIPLRRMGWFIVGFYWFNIILLLVVEFFGDVRLGAQRWIEIPFVHFTFQPSETMKPALILMLARLISKKPPNKNGYGLWDFTKISCLILLPFLLILKQPDLGTALVILLTGMGTLFLIGVNYRIWITLALIIGIASPLLYNHLHDYQKKRIQDFITKEPDYQVQQSMIAIGSGGLWGKDKDEATQGQLKFLPIATSDFIFAYYVERFGFIGALGLIFLYVLLITHIISFSFGNPKDYFLKTVSYSVGLLMFIYTGVNIAMTIGFAPVVGVPLPLFSYGGSSFITFMILFGILENLLAFRFKFLYNPLSFSQSGQIDFKNKGP